MQAETQNCQNCKKDFVIEPEDFQFYEKIKVPPPTWCPECRQIRRLAAAHSLRLFKRKCNAPGHSEELVSKYPAGSPRVVYDQSYWWSDAWNPMDYGKEVDFSKPFFEQLDELNREFPIPAVDVVNSVNSDYCITAHNCRDCYFLSGGFRSQNCLYSDAPVFCKDTVDSYVCLSSDTLYECMYCDGSYNLKYSSFSESCMDSAFLYDCRGCSDCFGCANLQNKKYYIFNVQYSKEEYFEKIKEFDLSSRDKVREVQKKYSEFLASYPKRFANIINSKDCTGDVIEEGKNCKNCFEVRQGAEDCRYCFGIGVGAKDSYDVFSGGATSALLYESKAIISSENILFSDKISNSVDISYSRNCSSSSYLFGCVGLRHKKYCILNKPYSKEEYERLIPEIISHMNTMPYIDSKGRIYKYGEFFPVELSPLSYNESYVQLLHPLTKDLAEEKGFRWQDTSKVNFEIDLYVEDIPLAIQDVEDDILDKVIECGDKSGCGHGCLGAFKVIPQELKFYRKTKTPIPDLCPVCRHAKKIESISFRIGRVKQTTRECDCGGVNSKRGNFNNTSAHYHSDEPCLNRFETSYSLDQSDIVYCEKCYQAETL